MCLSFIYRYSQVFNVVSTCHAADVPPVIDFFQKSAFMLATAAVINSHSSTKLVGRGGTKLYL